MPFGLLLDLWECHRQYNGIAKPKREVTIDEIISLGVDNSWLFFFCWLQYVLRWYVWKNLILMKLKDVI